MTTAIRALTTSAPKISRSAVAAIDKVDRDGEVVAVLLGMLAFLKSGPPWGFLHWRPGQSIRYNSSPDGGCCSQDVGGCPLNLSALPHVRRVAAKSDRSGVRCAGASYHRRQAPPARRAPAQEPRHESHLERRGHRLERRHGGG